MPEDKKTGPSIDVGGLIENAFLMGIGVLEVTREKVTEMTDELIDRGRMSQSEAKKVADRLTEIADDQQKVVQKAVAVETDKVMKATGMATKEDLDALKAEIADLKAMLAESRSGQPRDPGTPEA